MSRFPILLVGLCAALGSAPAMAQQPVAPTAVTPAAARVITLEEAMRLAEAQSEEVRIAEASVLRARAQQYRARSQYLPQLNASLVYQRTLASQFEEISELAGPDTTGGGSGGFDADNPIARIFASENQYTLGLSLSQNLFAGGRILGQTTAASALRDAADIGLTSARAQVRLTATEAYFDAVLSERLLAIAESSLVQTEAALRQTTLARQVGNTSEFELLRAQVTRDNQRPVVIQRRTARDIAYLRLKQLLDLPLDEPLRLTTEILDAPAAPELRVTNASLAMPADLEAPVGADTIVERRAPVRQAAEAVDAQRGLLRAARAQRIPALTLSSQYGRIAYPISGAPRWDESFNNWTVSVALSVPLFTGGRIRGDVMAAQADLAEARQRHQQTRELAALDAQVALAQLEEAQAEWQASLGTAEQAQRAYTIAEVRYDEGLSTQLELNESRILLQQAQANRALAARNLQVARVRLTLLADLPLSPSGSRGLGQQSQALQSVQPSGQSRAPAAQSTGGFPSGSPTAGGGQFQ